MALSDIILAKGEVIFILSNSVLGIVPEGTALNFGVIQMVNDLCDVTSVGASVWVDIEKAVGFMIISGQVFYKINEQYITAAETVLP